MRDLIGHDRTGRRRALRRSLASAVAAAGILAGMPVAAMADSVPAGQSSFSVNGERADFGSGGHVAGSPAGKATVAFTASPAPGNVLSVQATVNGTLYWGGVTGGCARVRTYFYDQTDTPIASISNNKCGPGVTFSTPLGANEPENKRAITHSYTSTRLRGVQVCTYEVVGETETQRACSPVMRTTAMADSVPAGQSSFRVNGERADFGSGGHVAGSPAGKATVAFTASPAPGNVLSVQATVNGTLYWGGVTGGCARVRTYFYDQTDTPIASISNNKCGPGVTFSTPLGANEPENKRAITHSYTSTRLRGVQVCTYEVVGETETQRACSPVMRTTAS